jgi:hypothetical protein
MMKNEGSEPLTMRGGKLSVRLQTGQGRTSISLTSGRADLGLSKRSRTHNLIQDIHTPIFNRGPKFYLGRDDWLPCLL